MFDSAPSPEWVYERFVVLLDDDGNPATFVAKSGVIAKEILAEFPPHDPVSQAAAASLERKYDGGVLVPLSGAVTVGLVLFGGPPLDILLYGLVVAASTVAYVIASRPPLWLYVKRRLPSGASRMKAAAISGLGYLLMGTVGSVPGSGVLLNVGLVASVCSCFPFIGVAMPALALVQYFRNR